MLLASPFNLDEAMSWLRLQKGCCWLEEQLNLVVYMPCQEKVIPMILKLKREVDESTLMS